MAHLIRTLSISVQHIVTAHEVTFESLQKVLPPDNLQVQPPKGKELAVQFFLQASIARHNHTLEASKEGSFMCSTLTSFLRPGGRALICLISSCCVSHILDMLDLFHMLDAPDTFYLLATLYLLPGWVHAQHGWLLAVQGPADQVGVDV